MPKNLKSNINVEAEQHLPQPTSLQHLVAGGTAGLVSRQIIAPLDVLKIRFQVQPIAASSTVPPKYRNLGQAINLILKEEGLAAFWKGNVSAQMIVLPYCSVVFFSYNWFNSTIKGLGFGSHNKKRTETVIVSLASGSFAGICATLVTYPFDLLRTRMAVQMQKKAYPNLRAGATMIYSMQGFAGFYHGLLPTLWGIVPYSALQFCFYEVFKEYQQKLHIFSAKSVEAQRAVAGFCAGLGSKLATLPFDTIKKRCQVAAFPGGFSHGQPGLTKKSSILAFTIETIRKEGVLTLWKGTAPSLIKAGPNSAIIFYVYNYVLDKFKEA